jgi:hypothetical protein
VTAYDQEAARVRAMSQEDFEDEFYERVIATIDLDALFNIEQELWSSLPMRDASLDGDDLETIDRVGDISKALVERLVVRAMSDERRYVNHRPPSEGDGTDCELCRQLREDYLRTS